MKKIFDQLLILHKGQICTIRFRMIEISGEVTQHLRIFR